MDERVDKSPMAQYSVNLYLFGEITDARAGSMVADIDGLMNDENAAYRHLRLWICSPGGDLGGALAIHDCLKRHPDLEAIATGNCQSAALVAFLGARTRWATPNTIFHNHEVVNELGQFLPQGFSLPALDLLKELPKGSFGPNEARACRLIDNHAVGLDYKNANAAAAGATGGPGYSGPGTVGIGPL